MEKRVLIDVQELEWAFKYVEKQRELIFALTQFKEEQLRHSEKLKQILAIAEAVSRYKHQLRHNIKSLDLIDKAGNKAKDKFYAK